MAESSSAELAITVDTESWDHGMTEVHRTFHRVIPRLFAKGPGHCVRCHPEQAMQSSPRITRMHRTYNRRRKARQRRNR